MTLIIKLKATPLAKQWGQNWYRELRKQLQRWPLVTMINYNCASGRNGDNKSLIIIVITTHIFNLCKLHHFGCLSAAKGKIHIFKTTLFGITALNAVIIDSLSNTNCSLSLFYLRANDPVRRGHGSISSRPLGYFTEKVRPFFAAQLSGWNCYPGKIKTDIRLFRRK